MDARSISEKSTQDTQIAIKGAENLVGELYVHDFLRAIPPLYAEDFAKGFRILQNAKIDRSENGSNNIKSYYQHMEDGPHIFKTLTFGLQYLYHHDILTDETFNILDQHPRFAEILANIIDQFIQLSLFDSLKSKIPDKKKLGEILLFISPIPLHHWRKILSLPTNDAIYHYIMKEDASRFDEYTKVAAYFTVNHKMIHHEFSQEKIHRSLSQLKPNYLRDRLKTIFNKLGGYSFMPDDEKNITIGVEIEYSNIPAYYKTLTESVMQMIQEKWSHPGDNTVKRIGIDSYQGEATTPIIRNNTDLKAAMLNAAFLQAMHAQTNESCGLHVHIGVENIVTPPEYKQDTIPEKIFKRPFSKSITEYQFEFIKQFILIYKREEKKFSSIERDITIPPVYCQAIIIPDDLAKIKDFDNLIQRISPDRYYELNLSAFDKHGTIEVRRFSGTTDESEIYATISMISAMAKEAQAKTNHIFDVKLKQELIQKGTFEEKTTPPERYQKTEENDTLPLSFVTQQKTERERELFMLRVKFINETQFTLINNEEKIKQNFSKNTVYLYLTNNDKDLGYLYYNEKRVKKTGTIYYSDEDQHDKRFNSIIDKIKQKKFPSITLKEKNQLFYEIAAQSGAHISDRIDKLKKIDCHARLFSTFIENHKKKVKENNSNNTVDHTVKFPMNR